MNHHTTTSGKEVKRLNVGVEKDLLETIHKARREDCIALIMRLRAIQPAFEKGEGKYLVMGIMEELFLNGGIDREREGEDT